MSPNLYSIEDYNSARTGGHGGLTITLAAEAVAAITRLDRKRNESLPYYTDLLSRIRNTVHPADAGFALLDFHADTWLLLGMHVGGQCACFGVRGARREQLARGEAVALRYECHNVDTREQAAAIVSTWLEWFNSVLPLTDLRDSRGLPGRA
jgi:hypothetical protein